jgi:hypothetical protein
VIVGGGLLAFGFGCGTIFPVRSEQLHDAKARKDVAFLKKICDGDLRVQYDGMKHEACEAQKELEAVGGNASGDGAAGVPAGKADCSTVVERYNSARGDREFQIAMAKQFAACGKYTELFEVVAHWGDDGKTLIAIDDKQLENEFDKYAASHAGPAFLNVEHGKHAMRNIGDWLTKTKHLGHCDAVVKAATGAKEGVRVWTLPYLREANCTTGTPIAVGLLTSEYGLSRKWACHALGDIGDASVIPKLKILANTDGWSDMQEIRGNSGATYMTKVYPVREACTGAAGKLELRK